MLYRNYRILRNICPENNPLLLCTRAKFEVLAFCVLAQMQIILLYEDI